MKLFLILAALAAVAVANPTGWEYIKSPMEQPRYREVLNKIYSQSNFNEVNEVSRGGRIVGGARATLGQFPYQIFTYLDDSWLCGGSIISKNHILTAGHCIYLIRRADVYAGTVDRQTAIWGTSVDSSNLILHSGYNDDTLINDIALIRTLAIPINGDTIAAVPLPSWSDRSVLLDGNNKTIVSGFGLTSDKDPNASIYLMYVEAPILPNYICEKTYGPDMVRKTNVCINTAGGRGSCQGDSGGPLTSVVNGRRTLIGVTSFGAAAGCERGYPAVFTRVSEFLDWINFQSGIVIED